jgi:hypothetical protein
LSVAIFFTASLSAKMSNFFGALRRSRKEKERRGDTVIGQPEVVPSTPGASEPGDDNKIRSDANLNAILGDEGNC